MTHSAKIVLGLARVVPLGCLGFVLTWPSGHERRSLSGSMYTIQRIRRSTGGIMPSSSLDPSSDSVALLPARSGRVAASHK